jgi:hypothetical protein
LAKVFVRSSGEKVPFDLILNPRYLKQYADGGMMAKGSKPKVIHTQFEEEEFEYADGGKTPTTFSLGIMKNEKIGGKDMLVSGQPVRVNGTMKDAEAKANELLKEDSSIGEINISKFNDKGRLGKKLKTIKK